MPPLEAWMVGSRVISLLRDINNVGVNAKRVECASQLFITSVGLELSKEDCLNKKQEREKEDETSHQIKSVNEGHWKWWINRISKKEATSILGNDILCFGVRSISEMKCSWPYVRLHFWCYSQAYLEMELILLALAVWPTEQHAGS